MLIVLNLCEFFTKYDKEHLEKYWSFDIIKELFELRKENESSHDQKELEQIDAELWLLNGPVDGDVWKWCLNNINQPYPKWKKEWVPIFSERLTASQASFPRAKYLYALWTLRKSIMLRNR